MTSQDLEIVHRNGRPHEVRGRQVPPTVTARLKSTVKKDSALRGYRNFDPVAKKPRNIKVYQSLTKNYSDLRQSIMKFFDPSEIFTVILKSVFGKYGVRAFQCTTEADRTSPHHGKRSPSGTVHDCSEMGSLECKTVG